MKWGALFLLIVSILVSLPAVLLQDPGRVEFVWVGYQVELSALVFILSLLVVFFVIFSFIWLVRIILKVPSQWSSSLRKSQKEKADILLLRILSNFESEEFEDAFETINKAESSLSHNSFFRWVSGQVFEKTSKNLEAEMSFVDLNKNPVTFFLGLKGQIRMALDRGDLIQAYDFLIRAQEIRPNSPWVLKNLLDLERHKSNFEAQEKLILRLGDLGQITSEQSKKQIAKIQYQRSLAPNLQVKARESFLRQAHYLDPSLANVTEDLALLLKGQEQMTYAKTAIEETWALSPSQKLGDLYLKLFDSKDKEADFKIAQDLVIHNPHHSESLIFLARTALDAKMWDEARLSLETLLKNDPPFEVYHLLAKLELETKNDKSSALHWLEKGLFDPRHI